MNEFVYSYPTKVYFGKGSAAKALKAELPKVGKNVMLAYGGSVFDCCKVISVQAKTADETASERYQ